MTTTEKLKWGLTAFLVLVVGSWLFGGSAQSAPPRGHHQAAPETAVTPSPARARTMQDDYEREWHSVAEAPRDVDISINRTLIANHVTGCGYTKYKKRLHSPGEYIVYCSMDEKNWVAYLVWGPIEKLMGPYAPDPSLQ